MTESGFPGGRWTAVYRSSIPQWPTPRHWAGPSIDFSLRLPRAVPEVGVLEVSEATVHGNDGWIETSTGSVLESHTWYGKHLADECGDVALRPRAPAGSQIHLSGTTLTLLTDWAEVYGHFLYDSLPRLHLFEQAGNTLTQVDHVLCAGPERLHHYVEQLGIPPGKCRWVRPDSDYRVERLLAPTFPGVRRMLQAWGAAFLRGRLRPPSGRLGDHGARRIYVQRRGTRQATNSDAVEELMADAGFELFEPLHTSQDPRTAFSQADVVVGPHSSALADLVFCAPGTTVLELVPTDHVYPYWYCASITAELDYSYLACPSTSVRPVGTLGPSPYDFTVDLDDLAVSVERVLSRADARRGGRGV